MVGYLLVMRNSAEFRSERRVIVDLSVVLPSGVTPADFQNSYVERFSEFIRQMVVRWDVPGDISDDEIRNCVLAYEPPEHTISNSIAALRDWKTSAGQRFHAEGGRTLDEVFEFFRIRPYFTMWGRTDLSDLIKDDLGYAFRNSRFFSHLVPVLDAELNSGFGKASKLASASHPVACGYVTSYEPLEGRLPDFAVLPVLGEWFSYRSMADLEVTDAVGVTQPSDSLLITNNQVFAYEQRSIGRSVLLLDLNGINWTSQRDFEEKYYLGFLAPLYEFLLVDSELGVPSYQHGRAKTMLRI